MTSHHDRAGLAHAIGADGIVSIRVRDGDLRLRAVDGDTLRDPRRRAQATSARASTSSSARAAPRCSIARARADGCDVARGGHAPGARGRAAAAGDARRRDGQRRDRGRGPASATSATRRRRATSTCGPSAAGWSSRPSRPTSTSARPARPMSPPGPCRATSSCAPGPSARCELTTTSGDVTVAGRLAGPGPVRDRDRQRRRPAGARRRRPDRDGDDVGRPALRARRPDRGRPRPPDARHRVERAAGHLPVDVRGPERGPPGRGRSSRAPVRRDAARSAGSARAAEPPPAAARAAASRTRAAEPPRNGAIAAAYEDARLGILRSLERGEIDVAEAGRRFEALDGGEPLATAAAADEPIDPASATTRMPLVGAGRCLTRRSRASSACWPRAG